MFNKALPLPFISASIPFLLSLLSLKHISQTLFGIMNGQCRANAFSVKINFADNNMDDLKKLIKQAKTPLWNYLAADELTLSRVSTPDDPNKQRERTLLRDVIFQKCVPPRV